MIRMIKNAYKAHKKLKGGKGLTTAETIDLFYLSGIVMGTLVCILAYTVLRLIGVL